MRAPPSVLRAPCMTQLLSMETLENCPESWKKESAIYKDIISACGGYGFGATYALAKIILEVKELSFQKLVPDRLIVPALEGIWLTKQQMAIKGDLILENLDGEITKILQTEKFQMEKKPEYEGAEFLDFLIDYSISKKAWTNLMWLLMYKKENFGSAHSVVQIPWRHIKTHEIPWPVFQYLVESEYIRPSVCLNKFDSLWMVHFVMDRYPTLALWVLDKLKDTVDCISPKNRIHDWLCRAHLALFNNFCNWFDNPEFAGFVTETLFSMWFDVPEKSPSEYYRDYSSGGVLLLECCVSNNIKIYLRDHVVRLGLVQYIAKMLEWHGTESLGVVAVGTGNEDVIKALATLIIMGEYHVPKELVEWAGNCDKELEQALKESASKNSKKGIIPKKEQIHRHHPYPGSDQGKCHCMYCGKAADSLTALFNGLCRKSKNGYHQPFAGGDRPTYLCVHCGKEAETLARLVNGICDASPTEYHEPYLGWKQSKYYCMYCGTSASTIAKLTDPMTEDCDASPDKKHWPFAGGPQPKYYCHYCGVSEETIQDLIRRPAYSCANKRHQPLVGWKQSKQECCYCGALIDRKKDDKCKLSPSKAHQPYAGPVQDQYYCLHCGATAPTIAKLINEKCKRPQNIKIGAPTKK